MKRKLSRGGERYRYKILLVDDQSFNIEALCIILKYCIGLESDVYCDFSLSGERALEMVESATVEQDSRVYCKYNLILMDCNMPGMDGYEATQKIREYLYNRGAKQPIISALTGHVEQMYVNKAID